MSHMIDIISDDGTHIYWSTWCRHKKHDKCKATELAPGVPRKPAQCKECKAPCVCDCHKVTFAWLLEEAARLIGAIPIGSLHGFEAMKWLDRLEEFEKGKS